MGNLFSSPSQPEDKQAPEPTPTPTPAPTEPTPAPAPAPDKPTTEQPKGDNKFAEELLDAQNTYRAKHGVPAMTLSKQLCEDAQKWADYIAGQNKLEHSSDLNGVGENLAWGSGEMSAAGTAKMWYDEIENYNFNNPGFAGNTGHFTQVVWKASTEFGAGIKSDGNGENGTYIVGRYSPAGNITNDGQFKENVLPPK